MKTLYVVRGFGCESENVWASANYEVTMLIEDAWQCCWAPNRDKFPDDACYIGFRRSTGIALRPGEYVKLQVKEK